MKSFRVIAARYDVTTDRIEVVKEVTNDDDSIEYNLHSFATETLEWKAAEYNIDDIDELVDIVIHEPFIEAVDISSITKLEAKDLIRFRIQESKSNFEDRRARVPNIIKTQMTNAGIPSNYVDAVDEDPILVIKQVSKFDTNVVQLKREFMESIRVKHQRNLENRPTPLDRIEELRSRLTTPRGTSIDKREKSVPKKPLTVLTTITMDGTQRTKDKIRIDLGRNNDA